MRRRCGSLASSARPRRGAARAGRPCVAAELRRARRRRPRRGAVACGAGAAPAAAAAVPAMPPVVGTSHAGSVSEYQAAPAAPGRPRVDRVARDHVGKPVGESSTVANPTASESCGRHGSKRKNSARYSGGVGSCVAAALIPSANACSRSRSAGREPCAYAASTDARARRRRARVSSSGDRRIAEHLGEPPEHVAPRQVDLEEPIAARSRSLRRSTRRGPNAARMCGIPRSSRTIVTGARSPQSGDRSAGRARRRSRSRTRAR